MLAQQASDFGVGGRKFHIKEKSMQLCVGIAVSAELTPHVG
jgi:hypothetical protein